MRDEQEQGAPVWHAIVGDGWRPVQFGEKARHDDEVLDSGGWRPCREHDFLFDEGNCMPRRRREASWEILMIKDGANYCRVKGVKPGEYFMVNEYGELILIDKPQAESTE